MEDEFSVWVGSLSLQCQEETLSDFFGKFGPLKSVVICRDELGKSKQFGYVNYFQLEVAECAATVMDGCKLLGQAIKTKGPNELQKFKNEQNTGARKEYRMFTDCLFFIDGRECTWNLGQCLFRHCDAAKETEMVCEKWVKRKCEDVQCPFRHPRLTKTPALVDGIPAVNRCPSHNAFKCFGECGNKDCNTHFLEHSAYLEHVKMAMKKLAQPLDTCTKCQAVFFKQEEKVNHRCYKNVPNPAPRSGAMSIQQFTSTRVQAEKDIVQPLPTYPNKTHFTTSPHIGPVPTQHFMKPQTNIKIDKKYSSPCSGSLQDCGKHSSPVLPKPKQMNYSTISTAEKHCPNAQNTHNNNAFNCSNSSLKQNSIPRQGSSSTTATCWSVQKALSPNAFNSTNLSSTNHVPKSYNGNVINTVNCSTNSEKVSRELEPVGVFWDFENCSVPKGKSAQAVVQKIRRVFFKEKREVEFMCVCDTSKEKKSVIEELNKAQVTVVHINATSKNAADDKLRQSLRRFAQTFSRPATVVLISGDGNFAMDLSDLRHRHNFQVVCLHNAAASSALLGFAHETHRFDLFTEDLQTIGQTPHKPSFSNEVLVSNLPLTKNANILKARLTKLSDNCGGKVLAINGNKAIVRFPNAEAAFRARRRLDKEDLFGYILRATLLPLASSKDGGDMTAVKRKEQENVSPVTTSSSSPLLKPFMDLGLNNPRSLKENQSPNSVNPARNFANEYVPVNSPPLRFPETRSHVSPPFPQFPGQQFPGHVMFNNMFHPTLLHSMFGLRGAATPSPVPITTAPSPLSAPTSPLRSVVNGMVRRSPSPEQQYNGVDLLVTNINESVPKKEIKKKLASVFREHCKVYSVVLHAKNGAPLRAFIKVPKLMDAHMAISKVTGKIVLGQVVHVSIASERDKELCYLQDEAVAVLQEAPLSWLPLTTFFENFEKKYRRHLDARHLDQIQDIVVVNGSAGCQTISLLEGKIDSQTLLVDNSFALDVFKLLHHYDGAIALVSFLALYWLEFHKEFELCSTGSILQELLGCIPNVTVVGTGAERSIQWLKKPGTTLCESMDLSVLSSQLVEMLQQDHEFEMTFERLQDKYLACYDKELDPACYGFTSLGGLCHSLKNILQVKEEALQNYVCLLREFRVKIFQGEISDLLAQQPDNSVLLSNFMASYVKHFGQKFKLSSFGFTRLTDLIKAVSSVAEIEGVGDQRTVTLVCKEERELSQKEDFDELLQLHDDTVHSVDQVKVDLVTLVNGQENKFVFVRNICKLYESSFYRKFPYDTSLLNEALECLEKPLEIRGIGNDRIVGIFSSTEEEIPDEDDFQFVKTAIEILYRCEEYTLPKARFQYFYQQNLRKNKNISEDDARLECFPSCVVVRDEDSEEIAELRRSYCVRILLEKLKQLFASIDGLSIPLDELPTRYKEYFQKSFNPKSYGLLCLEDLKDELIGFMEIASFENNVEHIALSPVCRFEHETKTLLESYGGCLSLSRFAPVYQQMYSKPCIVSDYGYTKLSSLINAVPHVARIIGSGPEKVVIAVEKSIPERVCSDMLSVRIIGGSTEEVFSTKKDKHVSPSLSVAQEPASCEETTVSNEVNTNLCSPAGQENTEDTRNFDNLPMERSNPRATPAKRRLAANFKFPLNGRK